LDVDDGIRGLRSSEGCSKSLIWSGTFASGKGTTSMLTRRSWRTTNEECFSLHVRTESRSDSRWSTGRRSRICFGAHGRLPKCGVFGMRWRESMANCKSGGASHRKKCGHVIPPGLRGLTAPLCAQTPGLSKEQKMVVISMPPKAQEPNS
jgi:hypothetical protein